MEEGQGQSGLSGSDSEPSAAPRAPQGRRDAEARERERGAARERTGAAMTYLGTYVCVCVDT